MSDYQRNIVTYESGKKLEILTPSPNDTNGPGKALNEVPFLIRAPEYILFNDKNIYLERYGLYRFITVGESIRNVILYDDPISLLSSLIRLQIHGNKYDSRDKEELYSLLPNTSWLPITCGPFCYFLKHIFAKENIDTRMVFINSGEKATGFDDGHVMLEIKLPEQGWILTDPALRKALYKKADKFLSAYEFWKTFRNNEIPEPFQMAKPQFSYFSESNDSNNFNFSIVKHLLVNNESHQNVRYQRLTRFIGILDDDLKKVFYLKPETISQPISIDKECLMEENQWEQKFYH